MTASLDRAVSGRAVPQTLNPAVEHGETGITVSYRPETNPIQYAENGALRVATCSAASPEDQEGVTWLLSGDDSGVFRFKALPDYEAPSDTDTNNEYEVTVEASDGALHRRVRQEAENGPKEVRRPLSIPQFTS